ncbi:phenylalanine--tRNA ligase subunit beta [Archaeoglobus sp.]|uniref:phenylalanine--tRNA ligase subunit beta n=1 Tax=Archaeoglobus sp. TaxID=1872626 RepID=UPI0024ABB2DE|nr:phenylalanine--tRNA ligase subunit beta [Archaeoglobus sp.]MDI3496637.1 phenylalanyl-tRNA synthetase beta chain [Archaeoglobus sp.]
MPVVTLYWDELERLVGADRDTILSRLPMLGCDIERVEDDHVDVEFFPNRPDLYSVEGVARALRGFLGIEKGLKSYSAVKGEWKITVEESVLAVRPRIVGCVVKGIRMTDEVIRSLMEVQEDLHWTIGRNRRKMAIGVHDLSKVYFPLRYKAVDANFSFVPLDFDREMTVAEILKEHPKGKAYAFILEGKDSYPMIVDSKDEVISFPPIINAEKTRVTEKTTDLFIDVTGFDENVDRAIAILACMLADRGGRIESVEVVYPDHVELTPNLDVRFMEVDIDEVNSLLGLSLSAEEIKEALEKMRFSCEIEGERLKVGIPPYRADIMHEWDVIEDVAIGYGYENITPEIPPTLTFGRTHPWNDIRSLAKEIMIGLGFTEVITFTLTNEAVMYEKMRRKGEPWKDYVPVMHPLTTEHTILRTSLLPKLLELLSYNKHHEMPQMVFEVGDVVVNSKNRLHLAACITHSRANFSEIRSYVQAVMRELDLTWEVRESDDDAFIDGRRAEIVVDGKAVGVFGEVHPEVLEGFELTMPVSAFEIDLSAFFDTGELL